MSQENKDIVRRFLTELQVDKRLEVVDELVSEDFIGHTAEVIGREQLKQVAADNLAAFPDMELTIEDQVAERDMVYTRYTARGKHEGTYRGVAATGKSVDFTVVGIHRLTGGKIVEGWRILDRLDIVHQIGAID